MTLRIGLVGAGPWATAFHAPALNAGPHTQLAAVWARREQAARTLAAAHGAALATSFDQLLDLCDAVAFAVPPDVQADLAVRAAGQGKHLLLEKPVAFTLAEAQRVAHAVEASGVTTLLVLTNRFTSAGRAFLDELSGQATLGAHATFMGSGALPGSPFATPWRAERGPLFDLGPHVLDLLDAALGPIACLRAEDVGSGMLSLHARHVGGQIGHAFLSITAPGGSNALWCRVHTDAGSSTYDGTRPGQWSTLMATIAREFAQAVASGAGHALDVHRGVYLQRLIEEGKTG